MDVGSRLRAAREARGVSLDTLSKILRVRPAVLNAIERNDAAGIPPRPYGRGFVNSYAAHVGLDPRQTVNEYFLQFAASPRPADKPELPTPARVTGSAFPLVQAGYVAVGVVLIALVGLAAPVLKRFTSSPSASAAISPHAAEPSASGSAPVGTGGSNDAEPAAVPAVPVTVEIEAVEPVWVTAAVDAQRTIYRTMKRGQRETLRGREIELRVGNAGLLRWRVNDAAPAVMGARGAVQSVRVTPAGTEVQPVRSHAR